MLLLYTVVLTLANLLFWFSILFNVPGTWLMVMAAVAVAWWQPAGMTLGWGAVAGVTGLALLGEILEFVLGAAGARQAGGSKRAALLAIAGGVVGAILGTALPIPIAGTLLGASLGAFAGSLLGDLWAGRPFGGSLQSGRGAAVGRFWGTMAKLGVGAVMVVVLALAPWL